MVYLLAIPNFNNPSHLPSVVGFFWMGIRAVPVFLEF